MRGRPLGDHEVHYEPREGRFGSKPGHGENILEIDEKGDEYVERPHIYTIEFDPDNGPYKKFLGTLATKLQGRQGDAADTKRIKRFPRYGIDRAR